MNYVIAQVTCLIVLLLQTNIYNVSILSAALVGIGVLIGILAVVTMKFDNIAILPQVKSNAVLVTSGIYTYIRHPMYSSIFLFFLGLVLTHPTPVGIAVYIALIITLYLKSKQEEKYLLQVFKEYNTYQYKSKRFIPYIW